MIDKACGYEPPPEPEPRRIANDDEKAHANAVASEVIYHIDQMYPGMWEGVPTTARLSVRNTIINRVTALLLSRANAKIQP
jgi:hypothetical protein